MPMSKAKWIRGWFLVGFGGLVVFSVLMLALGEEEEEAGGGEEECELRDEDWRVSKVEAFSTIWRNSGRS